MVLPDSWYALGSSSVVGLGSVVVLGVCVDAVQFIVKLSVALLLLCVQPSVTSVSPTSTATRSLGALGRPVTRLASLVSLLIGLFYQGTNIVFVLLPLV